MAMPMQVSLDEILSMLLARVDSLVLSDEFSTKRESSPTTMWRIPSVRSTGFSRNLVS